MCGRIGLFKVGFEHFNISPTNFVCVIKDFDGLVWSSESNDTSESSLFPTAGDKESGSDTVVSKVLSKVDGKETDSTTAKKSKYTMMKWGFPLQTLVINVRDDSNSFTNLRNSNRCIIPANCFYEWHHTQKSKQAYCIMSDRLFYFGGLYQYFHGELHVVIMTTSSTKELEFLHHRMPVIFTEKESKEWLDSSKAFQDVKHLIVSKREGYTIFPVSSFVNKAQNQGRECIEPVKIPKQLPFSFGKSVGSAVRLKDTKVTTVLEGPIPVAVKEDTKDTPILIKEDTKGTASTAIKDTKSKVTDSVHTKKSPAKRPRSEPSPKKVKNQKTIDQFFLWK